MWTRCLVVKLLPPWELTFAVLSLWWNALLSFWSLAVLCGGVPIGPIGYLPPSDARSMTHSDLWMAAPQVRACVADTQQPSDVPCCSSRSCSEETAAGLCLLHPHFSVWALHTRFFAWSFTWHNNSLCLLACPFGKYAKGTRQSSKEQCFCVCKVKVCLSCCCACSLLVLSSLSNLRLFLFQGRKVKWIFPP